MRARVFRFHHLHIEHALSSGVEDPFRSLLAHFTPPHPHVAAPERQGAPSPQEQRESPPSIQIITTRASGERVPDEWYRTLKPAFFHGALQAFVGPSATRLTDGRSRAELSLDGAKVSLDLVTDSDGELEPMARVMAHLALVLALRAFGLFELHAAGAVWEGLPLVLAGESGVGKTTTLLSLLAAGADYLSDDRLLLRRGVGPEAASLLSFPREMHVTPAIQALPLGRALALGKEVDAFHKRALAAEESFPGKFVPEVTTPGALLFLRVRPQRETCWEPLSPADALAELLPSSVLATVPEVTGLQENLALLGVLARSWRAFRLELGEDLLLSPEQAAARWARGVAESSRSTSASSSS